MKKLIVFFDGTWNREDQRSEDGAACPTNIAKLFEATLSADTDGHPQIVHYVRGVGTRRTERIKGGGFGYGISDNIKEGYRFLASNYNPGDAIYIFGFSRGAYTARSLAGMIRNFSLLKREKIYLTNEVYKHYKDNTAEWLPDSPKTEDFKRNHAWENVTIHFLGVFDTVGALGAPFGIVLGWVVNKLFKTGFHDTRLSSIIENAYHALAVDEKRLPFQPTLMQPNKRQDASSFEQKWFPGVHSNIGGGYNHTGLSDQALQWMADKATACGLNLDLTRITNPKFQPDWRETPKKSQTFFYRILAILFIKLPGQLGIVPSKYKDAVKHLNWLGDYIRPIDDKGNIDAFIGNPPSQPIQNYQGSLDISVLQKINAPDQKYKPRNVLSKK